MSPSRLPRRLLPLLLSSHLAASLNNGLGLTPPLGYNSYDHVGCCANETLLKQQGEALISTGLHSLGFRYVNMDCGWMGGRHSNGTLFESPTKFPSGIRALADWMHARGLKLGVYSDRGTHDFSGAGLGMKGHEDEDARWMADAHVDYLKVDDMSGDPKTEAGAYADYARIRDALNATGRPIFFSTCGHSGGAGAGTPGTGNPAWMGGKCAELANACRIAADVRFWGPGTFGTNKAVNNMASYGGAFGAAGAWPDPDLLYSYGPVGPKGGRPATCGGAGKLEYCTGSFCDPVPGHAKTQYGLWAVMGAPLLISFDLTSLDKDQLALYTNPEIVAINQDADDQGRGTSGGRRVSGGDFNISIAATAAAATTNILAGTTPQDKADVFNVWARNLHSGDTAVIFVNNQAAATTMTCNAACAKSAGLGAAGGKKYAVRDVYARKDLASIVIDTDGGFSSGASVAGDGGSAFLRLTPL